MLEKKYLLEIMNNALDSEEEANNHFYTYTINSLKYYEWLSEENKEKIKEIVTKLRDDSQRHKNMLENLIQHIQESEKMDSDYSEEALSKIFQRILQFEEEVKDLYDNCIEKLEDDNIKDVLKTISKEEKGHIALAKELIEIIKK